MKQILQRVAFFSFLGCLTLIGIANSESNPHMKCHEEWKNGFVNKDEAKESLVVTHTHHNGYELNRAGNIFSHIVN